MSCLIIVNVFTNKKDKMDSKLNHTKWAYHKKSLHRKRKNRKKRAFVPRIIVDTNIWYQLGKDDALFNKVKDKLTPVYNNLWEMANTGALYERPDMVRNGIRKAMLCSKRMIITEPLRYLAKRANRKFQIKMRMYTKQMLIFTQKIANGCYIDEKQKEEFHHYILQSKEQLKLIAEDFNNTALECKSKIQNYKNHREANTYFLIIQYLDFMVHQATDKQFNLKKLPLKEYELLILVLDKFFKDLETGERKWQRNDLFDIFNLAYVRRGDKYWTNEKKWINIIKDVGCEHYLYES